MYVSFSVYICMYIGGPDVVLEFHDVVWLSSNAPVVLTSGQSVAAGCETNPLIRAHGIHGRGKPTHACTCLCSIPVQYTCMQMLKSKWGIEN